MIGVISQTIRVVVVLTYRKSVLASDGILRSSFGTALREPFAPIAFDAIKTK
jgi:hypothetical protein